MQNKGLLWSLLVGAIIVLASISCSKNNTATSIDSSLNSRSFSTWISDNSTSRPPFKLSAWQDNLHSCDLELTWRGDGSLEEDYENLYIFEKDRDAVGVDYNKTTTQYPAVTVSDGNYNGKVDFADFGVIGAGYQERFCGFYLYWDAGNKLDLENLDDNDLYNDLGTTSINESVTGYAFDNPRFTALNNGERNSYGFFEYNLKPISNVKDGNGQYTIPLLNQGDYFVLVPFDNNGTTITKKKELAQQFQVKTYPPYSLKINWYPKDSKVVLAWMDQDTSGDDWDLTVECNYGTWVEGGQKTITKTDLTTKTYTLYWDPTGVPDGKKIEVKAIVVDKYDQEDTDVKYWYTMYATLNCAANNIWFTYKCANNPPKEGDWLFVYLYSQIQYNSNNGNFNVYLWSPENTLVPETPQSAGYPNSCFNIGGRGTNTEPDGITSTGVVTTPSSQYSLDRSEGFESGLNNDEDYGIWTANNQSIGDYEFWLDLSKSFLPIKHDGNNGNSDLSDPSTYYTMTLNQTRSFGQSSILNLGTMLNDGDPVDVWQYGFITIGTANIDKYSDASDDGYLMNCVYKVVARKGTKVKLGLLTGKSSNEDLSNLTLLSGYSSDEAAYNVFGTNGSNDFAPYVAVNEISFTVQ